MEKLSRRQLFHYSTTALVAGTGFAVAQKALSDKNEVPPVQSAMDRGLFEPTNPSDFYRLYPQSDTRKPFGIVKDFFEHIQTRDDVKQQILYWLTDGRASFIGGASRFQFLEHTIRPMYEAAGMPVELGFGLGMQESVFRNYSVSHTNARGIWQMQWAGRKYGLRGGDYFDIVKSTEKQLEYLEYLVQVFDWQLELVMVDYNYSRGRRYARYRSDPDAFRRIYRRLPRQTRRFVPRVLAAIALGLEPERYGVSIPRLDTRTADFDAPRDIHHLELGLLLGTDHWNLGNLNPRENIRVWFKEGEIIRIPKVYEDTYHDRINGHPLRSDFHQLVAEVYAEPGQDVRYVVRRGDNLARIADKFRECGVKGSDHLMLYNGLTSTIIRPGQELVIPCNTASTEVGK